VQTHKVCQLNVISCLTKSDLEKIISIDILPTASGLQQLFDEGALLPKEFSFGLTKTLSSPTIISRRLSSFIGGRVALRRAIASVSSQFNNLNIKGKC